MKPSTVSLFAALLALVLVTFLSSARAEGTPGAALFTADKFAFAVISDLHIGRSPQKDTADKTRAAVAAINARVTERSIRFVVITGDLTESALPSQFTEARSLLDELAVPYFPLLGNHDVWSYYEPISKTSLQEPYPTGDQHFVETFGDIFAKHDIYRDFEIHTDPASGFNVTLINFEIQIASNSSDARLVLLALDYNPRLPDPNPFAYFKGVGSSADLHIWHGGSFYWAKSRLDELANVSLGNVVFLHHHTYSTSPYFMPDYVGMNNEDRANVKLMIENVPFNLTAIWGAIVGHMHFWDEETTMFDTFTQWVNSGTFIEGDNSISIVTVSKGSIQNIERCCGLYTQKLQTILRFTFSTFSAFLQIFVFYAIYYFVNNQSTRLEDVVDVNSDLQEKAPSNRLCKRQTVGKVLWSFAFAAFPLSLFLPLLVWALSYRTLGVLADTSAVPLYGSLGLSLGLFLSFFAAKAAPKSIYVCFALSWVGIVAVDLLRFDVRSNWTTSEIQYNEFFGVGIAVISTTILYLLELVVGTVSRKAVSPVPRVVLWISYTIIPGMLLDGVLSMVTAFIHRIEYPIYVPEFVTFIVVLVVVLISSLATFPFFVAKLVAARIHPLSALSNIYIVFTLMNVAQHLLLRETSVAMQLPIVVLLGLLSGMLFLVYVFNIVVNAWNYVEEFDILHA